MKIRHYEKTKNTQRRTRTDCRNSAAPVFNQHPGVHVNRRDADPMDFRRDVGILKAPRIRADGGVDVRRRRRRKCRQRPALHCVRKQRVHDLPRGGRLWADKLDLGVGHADVVMVDAGKNMPGKRRAAVAKLRFGGDVLTDERICRKIGRQGGKDGRVFGQKSQAAGRRLGEKERRPFAEI